MEPKIKEFHIGTILSITTGVLLAPNHMDDIYDILDFLTGEDLFTHMLPDVAEEMTPFLMSYFPFCKEASEYVLTKRNEFYLANKDAKTWHSFEKELNYLVEKYGEYHKISL